MHLGELKPTPRRSSKRPGRGNGSGMGKTCGRGTKGQGARSGGNIHPWFEGGQMPLYRRLPIRGFNNARFANRYQLVKLSAISKLPADQTITPEVMADHNLIASTRQPVKILGDQDLGAAYKVQAHRFTRSAISRIQSAGGQVIVHGQNEEQGSAS